MSQDITLGLNAIYRGQAAFAKAQSDLANLENKSRGAAAQAGTAINNATSKIGAGFSKLASSSAGPFLLAAGMGAATMAIKGTYAALGQGADLVYAQEQFNKLTVSINSTSDAMMGKLKDATSGLMTNAQMVASANQIMSLGLAKTEEDVVRLVNVAGKLGWDAQTMVLTFANNSKMRLDSLGLSVEDVTTRMEKLKAAGMDADKAFDLAVIEAGEAKIELLGDKADSTAGRLKTFEVALANAGDAAKIALANMAADPIEALGESLTKKNVVADMTRQMKELNLEADQYKIVTAVTGSQLHWWRDGFLEADEMAQRLPITLRLIQDGFSGGTEELKDLVDAMVMGKNINEGSLNAWLNTGAAVDEIGAAAERTIPRLSNLIGTLGFISQAQWDFAVENGTNERRAPAAPTGPRKITLRNADYATRMAIGKAADIGDGISRLGRETEKVATGFGSWVAPIDEAAAALQNLDKQAGSIFASLKGKKEFNLADELFGIASKSGQGALDLANLGIASGLFDEARANEMLNQTFLLQSAEQLAGQLSGADLWATVSGLQGQLGSDAGLAREFFGKLDEATIEPDMSMNTDPAWIAYMNLQSQIENNPLVATVRVNYENAVDAVVRTIIEGDQP
jgi:hypothetical protein